MIRTRRLEVYLREPTDMLRMNFKLTSKNNFPI